MRIHIDFSIFTSTPSAEGVISGKIELSILPRTGEIVSFLASPNEAENITRRETDVNRVIMIYPSDRYYFHNSNQANNVSK